MAIKILTKKPNRCANEIFKFFRIFDIILTPIFLIIRIFYFSVLEWVSKHPTTLELHHHYYYWIRVKLVVNLLPEMISGHVLYVLVDHVKSDSFRLAIAPYGPGVLVTVVALCFRRRCHHATGSWRWHAVLIDTCHQYARYDFAQSVGQHHLQVDPDRTLKTRVINSQER